MLKTEPWLAEVLNRSILVTGAPRSGTTLLGNLLHSCKEVEYLFEPQVVLPLLALIDSIAEADWRTIFETTLVAEGMADRIAGRSINLNPHDESSFLKAKGEPYYQGQRAFFDQVEDRWDQSWSRADTTLECQRRTLVWKSPEAGMWAPELKRLYPGMTVVAIWRAQEDAVRSMIEKGWFAHDKEARWFHQEGEQPFWWSRRKGVGAGKFWMDLDEGAKASTLWSSIWAGIGKGAYLVDYRQFCEQPEFVFSRLLLFLGLERGSMTGELLRQVRPGKE